MNLNIGGGKGWEHKGWINLDASRGHFLTPETVFPVPDKSCEIVYSSHAFEHLSDETVDQMLRETRRVLKGTFVLKIPDYDAVLDAWRNGDEEYLSAERWGMTKVIPTWKNKDVKNSLDHRASMVFCGWWNNEYGDEFGSRNPEAEGAYHGPTCSLKHVYTPSAHAIAAELVDQAPDGGHFNHRNAWSRDELRNLLKRRGFTALMDVIPMDLDIPGLLTQRDISLYCISN